MPIRTEISNKHLLRLAVVGLFCTGAALWFLYDGLVGYPAKRERGIDFVQFAEENQDMEQLERLNAWKARAEERGWPTDNPLDDHGEPVSITDINGQFIWAAVAGLIGLIFLIRLMLNWGCWVEADDEGLRAYGGRELKYSQITKLNKKKWQSKGIAYAHYEQDGKRKRLLIDDYIYDRDTTRQILRKVEDNIDHAKIVNGRPEPPLKPAEASEIGASGA